MLNICLSFDLAIPFQVKNQEKWEHMHTPKIIHEYS